MRHHSPAAVAIATATATRAVLDAIDANPGRAVLVRSPAGGGAALVVGELGAARAAPGGARLETANVDLLDPATLLSLRGVARQGPLVLATERREPGRSARALLDYLRPVELDVEPLTIDEVTSILEEALGDPVDDRDGARVRRWTDGWIDDTLAVAAHLATRDDGPDTTRTGRAAIPGQLRGFEPDRARRLRRTASAALWAPWALVADARATGVPVDRPATPDRLRPVDAAASVGDLTHAERRAALDIVLDRAAPIPAASLDTESLFALGAFWCEADRAVLDAGELGQLVGALQRSFERNRLVGALPIAARLWQRSRVPLAGVALASVLGRAPSDAAHRSLLDDLGTSGSPPVVDAAAAAEATWRFHHDGLADEAIASLRDRLEGAGASGTDHDAVRSTLATLELHRGRPDAAEALLETELEVGTDTRVGPSDMSAGPTPFGLNTLVLADLARGRHRRAIDRLDAELAQRLDPGPNLSVDRDRFFRDLVAAEAGWADAATTADLDRSYQRALDGGDDWSIGWMGWGAGLQAARVGRFLVARRRLRSAVAAFERAGRAGFAMWPASALVELDALTELGAEPETEPARIPFDHGVRAGRARAELALALAARASGASTTEVAPLLERAAATARSTGEVTTARLTAIEQLLAGLPARPAGDEPADGVVVDVAAALDAAGTTPATLDDAGRTLVGGGWVVLGVRLRAAAAARLSRSDPRSAGRILQELRTTTSTFDAPLRPWVLADQLPDLPTLSPRELEVARAVASGATRDEVAAALVLSRRTIDSHLQRVYAKLGISSRSELRTWLDRAET